MSSGIRATVAFEGPTDCPVARFADATGTTVDNVTTSVATGDVPVTEFLVDAETDAAVEPVFSYGSAELYRIEHGDRCPCSCLGEFGCPIHHYTAENGNLTVVFHAEEFDQLQELMATLRDRYPSVDVQRLLQPPLEGSPRDRLFVNRGKLTSRQLEVLRTAYENGYFEQPKRANATELAEQLGISQSTFTEHLVAAQRKLLDDVLDGV
jgi:hypothetical protein